MLCVEMKRSLIMLGIILGATATANADVASDDTGWYCGGVSDWEIAQVIVGEDIVLNNFLLDERDALMANSLRVIELSYSATNRSSDVIAFNSQVVGFDEVGRVTFALEANPSLEIMSDRTTETITGDSYVVGSPLTATKKLCIGFFADL